MLWQASRRALRRKTIHRICTQSINLDELMRGNEEVAGDGVRTSAATGVRTRAKVTGGPRARPKRRF